MSTLSDQPDEARPGKFEHVITDAGHHLRIVGANGEIVFTTEVYEDARSVQGAMNFLLRTVEEATAQVAFDNTPAIIASIDERKPKSDEKWHIAECVDCHGTKIPFGTLEDRRAWVAAHRLATGHKVKQYEEEK